MHSEVTAVFIAILELFCCIPAKVPAVQAKVQIGGCEQGHVWLPPPAAKAQMGLSPLQPGWRNMKQGHIALLSCSRTAEPASNTGLLAQPPVWPITPTEVQAQLCVQADSIIVHALQHCQLTTLGCACAEQQWSARQRSGWHCRITRYPTAAAP